MQLLISMPGGAEWLMIVACGLLFLLVPLMALIEIIRSQFVNPENKIIWVLVVLIFPFIGSILYWAIGRSQRVQ